MGSVVRHTYTKIDPKTGKRVTKRTKKWYVEYTDPDGAFHRVAGYTDKQATEKLRVELEQEAARVHSGFIPANPQLAKVCLNDHLADYLSYLQTRNNTSEHIALVKSRSLAIIAGCQFGRWGDLDHARLLKFLAVLREGGRAIQTSNHYLSQFRGFVRWLAARMKAADPLAECKPLNVETDRRHVRRALSDVDFQKLLDTAAQSSKRVLFLNGRQRSMLYLTAAYTGLRASELASLTVESFSLDADPPTVTVAAGYSKRRRLDVIPLPGVLVEQLRGWLHGHKKSTPLFPGDWADDHHGAVLLRADLRAAGIHYNLDGRFFDFHALRGQYGTALARAGVPLVEAQRLMRHSTPVLTAKTYTHLELRDLGKAAEKLGSGLGELGVKLGCQQAKTGKMGRVEASSEQPGDSPQKRGKPRKTA